MLYVGLPVTLEWLETQFHDNLTQQLVRQARCVFQAKAEAELSENFAECVEVSTAWSLF